MRPEKPNSIKEGITELIARFDPKGLREGMQKTPQRYLDMMQELTEGYDHDSAVILKQFDDDAEHYDQMIFQGNIPVMSLCEHHLLPFFGVAHVAYIPKGRIVGLSKLTRVVECYAKRFQMQERLTQQVAAALADNLKTIGVGVVLRCRHLCMEARGVKKPGVMTYTSALLGDMKSDGVTRAEFLHFVQIADSRSQSSL